MVTTDSGVYCRLPIYAFYGADPFLSSFIIKRNSIKPPTRLSLKILTAYGTAIVRHSFWSIPPGKFYEIFFLLRIITVGNEYH